MHRWNENGTLGEKEKSTVSSETYLDWFHSVCFKYNIFVTSNCFTWMCFNFYCSIWCFVNKIKKKSSGMTDSCSNHFHLQKIHHLILAKLIDNNNNNNKKKKNKMLLGNETTHLFCRGEITALLELPLRPPLVLSFSPRRARCPPIELDPRIRTNADLCQRTQKIHVLPTFTPFGQTTLRTHHPMLLLLLLLFAPLLRLLLFHPNLFHQW